MQTVFSVYFPVSESPCLANGSVNQEAHPAFTCVLLNSAPPLPATAGSSGEKFLSVCVGGGQGIPVPLSRLFSTQGKHLESTHWPFQILRKLFLCAFSIAITISWTRSFF